MKPETTRGARRLVPRRRRGRHEPIGARGDAASEARTPGDAADFDPVEFAEFLEADDASLSVDPAFRERLRHELWGMVRAQAERKRPAPRPLGTLPDPKRPR